METIITRYGTPAVLALRDAINRCRESDLLKPITIIVPSVAVGMPVLQELARLPGQPRGVFGVRHWTVSGLADHILNLSEPTLRRRRSDRVVAAALRQIDDDTFGVFKGVRHHPATEQVLIKTLKELEQLDDLTTLENLPNQKARHLAELERTVREKLDGKWFSNVQILNEAVRVLQNLHSDNQIAPVRSPLHEIGTVIVFLPQHLTQTECELLRLCKIEEIIVALTGNEAADRSPLRCAQLLGFDLQYHLAAQTISTGTQLLDASLELDENAPPPTLIPSKPLAQKTTVVSAPTAKDEVRLAVRGVMEAIRDEIPAERLAIAYTSRVPYARLLVDHLREVGISFNFASGFPLQERVVPKAILAMLQLEETNFNRSDLINLLASAPIVAQKKSASVRKPEADGANPQDNSQNLVPPWDRISRQANVTGGRWKECLSRFVEIQQKDLQRKTDDPEIDERRAKRAETNISFANSLARFVKDLKGDLEAVSRAKTWPDKTKAVRKLIDHYIQTSDSKGSAPAGTDKDAPLIWNDDEEHAKEKLFSILAKLEVLQEVEPFPSQKSFIQAFTQELEANEGRIGRDTKGVRLLSADSLLSGSTDRLWVTGMSEGLFPQKLHEDSLLPDSLRESLSDLPLKSDRMRDQHRHFLVALQLAHQELTLSYSRQDNQGNSLPSRWLLDVVFELSGERVFAGELDEFLQNSDLNWDVSKDTSKATSKAASKDPSKNVGKFVTSTTADLQQSTFASNEQEFNLKTMLPLLTQQSTSQRTKVIANLNYDPLAAGVEMIRARDSKSFTRFDGNLLDSTHSSQKNSSHQYGSQKDSDPKNSNHSKSARSDIATGLQALLSEPFSPSRLQNWVECPYGFFMTSVLGVRPLDEVEELERLSPLVRGAIIHDTLEIFFREEMEKAGTGGINPDAAWGDDHKSRLREIAIQLCEEAIADNRFGFLPYHDQQKQEILEDLCLFLDDDSVYRQESRARPLALEAEFGYTNQPLPKHQLPDGTILSLRGRIDRIDIRYGAAGEAQIIVIDYKTGKHDSGEKLQQYKNLNETNPHGQGRRLQLPLYASAALELPSVKEVADTGFAGGGNALSDAPEVIYWFVTSRSKFFRDPLVLSSQATEEIDKALEVVYSGIQQGLFPAGLHKTSQAGVACEWCNPDRFGPSKHNVRRKLNSPSLHPWLELAYPKDLPAGV